MAIAAPSAFDYLSSSVAPAVIPQAAPDPTFMETLDSSFKRVSIFADPYLYLTEGFNEDFNTFDENFDPATATKNSPYWESPWRDNFAVAMNQQQWDYIAKKIERENKWRATREASGWTGFFTDLAVGIVSPENFIPGVTAYKGLVGVVGAAGLGLLSVSVNEAVKQAAQETRTAEETATNLVAGAVIGGMFGVGANVLRGWQQKRLIDNLAADMALVPAPKYGANSTTVRVADNALPVVINSDNTIIPPASMARAELQTLRELEAFSDIRNTVMKAVPNLAVAETETVALRESILTTQAAIDDLAALPQTEEIAAELVNLRTFAATQEAELLNLTTKTQKEIDAALVDWDNSPAAEALRDLEVDSKLFLVDTRRAFDETPISAMDDLEDAVIQDGIFYRQPTVFGNVGAAAVDTDVGELAALNRVKKSGSALISPVVQTLAQNVFPLARNTMAQLGTAGLRFARNLEGVAAAAGGTLETIIHRRRDTLAYKATVYLDDAYATYLYSGQKKSLGATRARLRSTFRATGDKLSRPEFNMEVSRAMRENDVHPIPEVAASAKFMRETIFDPILDEAIRADLFGPAITKKLEKSKADRDAGIAPEGNEDLSYLNRIYNHDAMIANPQEFVRRIEAYYKQMLINRAGGWTKIYQRALERYKQADALAKATPEEIEQMQADLAQARLNMGETDEEIQLKSLIRERGQLKKAIREKTAGAKAPARMAKLQEEIKDLRKTLAPRLRERSTIARRLRVLNKTETGVAKTRNILEERIGRIEEEALNSLNSVLSRGQRLERSLQELKPAQLKREVKLLQMQLDNLGQALKASMKRIEKARKASKSMAYRVLPQELQYAALAERLIAPSRKKIQFEDMQAAREDIAALLQSVATEGNQAVNKLNLARGERIAKIKQNMDELDPQYWNNRAKVLEAKLAAVEDRLTTVAAKAGLPDFNARTGEADFTAQANKAAWDTYNKILQFDHKVGGIDLAMEERGSALARTLTIPSAEIADFLENDIEVVIRHYLRQMVPDLELKKRFGDVELKTQRDLMKAELNEILARGKVTRNVEKGTTTVEPWTKEENAALNLEFETHMNNIMASVARLRNQWGLPKDPHGFGARAGKFMLDWNNMAFMGMVMISSLADPSRIVTKNGFTRSMKTVTIPFIHGLKGLKMSRAEARQLGIGLDPYTHSRAAALSDLMDEQYRTSKFEQLVHVASSKFGNFAGFNYYTQFMKDWNHVTAVARLSDEMQTLFEGTDEVAIQKATAELAYLQIDANMARRIWDEMKENSSVVSGVKIANTGDWKDRQAADAWGNAMVQLSRDTIIEPGVELPLFMNAGVIQRLFFQFKSFVFASHTKTLAANMQQADSRVFAGIVTAIGLGMVSYYVSAIVAGGEAQKRMEAADFNAWVDEGIARGGLLGAFDMALRVANKMAPVQALNSEYPLLDTLTPFAGQPLSRYGTSGLAGEIFGPTGDRIARGLGIIQTVQDPTDRTVRNVRMLMPGQNTILLRRIFDALEEQGKELVENEE